MLELYQAEWCPHSHAVRERLTELGIDFIARQVPAEPEDRVEMKRATGTDSIPVLVADGEVLADEEDTILAWLDANNEETAEAEAHREKEKAHRE